MLQHQFLHQCPLPSILLPPPPFASHPEFGCLWICLIIIYFMILLKLQNPLLWRRKLVPEQVRKFTELGRLFCESLLLKEVLSSPCTLPKRPSLFDIWLTQHPHTSSSDSGKSKRMKPVCPVATLKSYPHWCCLLFCFQIQGMIASPPDIERPYKAEPLVCAIPSSSLICRHSSLLLFVCLLGFSMCPWSWILPSLVTMCFSIQDCNFMCKLKILWFWSLALSFKHVVSFLDPLFQCPGEKSFWFSFCPQKSLISTTC